MALNAHLAGSDPKVVKYTKKTYDIYPSDWVRKSINSGLLKIVEYDRGFFLPTETGIPLKHGRGGNTRDAYTRIAEIQFGKS